MIYRNKTLFTQVLILIFFQLALMPFGDAKGKDTVGIAALEQLLKSNPGDVKVRQTLAKAYFKDKQFEKCEEILAAYKEEISRKYVLVLADCQHELKKYDYEVKTLTVLNAEKRKDFSGLIRIARSYRAAEKYNDAIKYYRKALKIEPEHKGTYNDMLDIYKHTKNTYEQRVLLKEMIEVFGDRPSFYHQLCEVFSKDGYVEDTIRYCSQAIDIDRKHAAHSYVFLAKAYLDSNEKAKAKKLLKVAAKRYKKDELVQWFTGDYFLKIKDFHSALRYFQNGVSIDKKSSRSFLGLAESRFSLGKFEEAFDAYKVACDLDRETYFFFRKATSILQQERKYELHRKYLRASNACRLRALK